MSQQDSKSTAIAIDESIVYGCHFFTVVTQAHIAFFGILPSNREALVLALQSGDDPISALKQNAAPEGTATLVSLSSLEALDWYSDCTNINLRYFDSESNKLRSEVTTHSTTTARDQVVEAIKQGLPSCEVTEAPASVLYFGITQLVISVLTLLFCGALAIAAYVSRGPINADNQATRKAAGLAFLLKSLGPAGVILLGMVVIGSMVLWLYLAKLKAPTKSVCRTNQAAGNAI